jgi:hypothetical protein
MAKKMIWTITKMDFPIIVATTLHITQLNKQFKQKHFAWSLNQSRNPRMRFNSRGKSHNRTWAKLKIFKILINTEYKAKMTSKHKYNLKIIITDKDHQVDSFLERLATWVVRISSDITRAKKRVELTTF